MKSNFFLLTELLVCFSGCKEDINTFETHPNNSGVNLLHTINIVLHSTENKLL